MAERSYLFIEWILFANLSFLLFTKDISFRFHHRQHLRSSDLQKRLVLFGGENYPWGDNVVYMYVVGRLLASLVIAITLKTAQFGWAFYR
jgi:hypothetical protein